MKYKIKVNYDTGNSLGREPNQEDFITPEWNSLDVAKENLKRLKDFTLWTEQNRRSWRMRGEEKIEPTDFNWYTGDEYSLYLYTDKGKRLKQQAFWVGYFESLNFMEIVSDNSDMRFEL
jgi:hypothetical protein